MVRQLGPNHWQADAIGKDGRRRRRNVTGTRKQALMAEAELMTANDPTRPERMTLGEFVETRWAPAKRMKRDGTWTAYERHLKHYVLPAFGQRRLAAITADDVQQWVFRLAAEPGARAKAEGKTTRLSEQTVIRIYSTMRSIMRLAAARGLATPLPPASSSSDLGITLPQPSRPDLHVPTGDEAMRIIRQLDDRYQAVGLLGISGLRLGEALGLSPRDVGWDTGTVRIYRTLEKSTGQIVRKTKTNHERTITLPGLVLAGLERTRDLYATADLLFHRDGAPMDESKFWRYHWKPARERAELPRVRFHDLRHACASLLAAEGASPKEVQEHLGHATAGFTLERYTHLWPDAARRTGAKLGNALDQADVDGEREAK